MFSLKPKLLFISPSSPFPARDGKRQRTLALLLAALQEFEVDFLLLDSPKELEMPDWQLPADRAGLATGSF